MLRHLLSIFAILIAPALSGCSRPARIHLTFPTMNETVVDANASTRVHGVATKFGGQIPVFVGPSEKPQVLHFSSVYSSIWHVYLRPGANVSEIYVSAFDPQSIRAWSRTAPNRASSTSARTYEVMRP
jgi:hypothetical protein